MTMPNTLETLYDLMRARDDDAWRAAGLPIAHGEQDWTSLPTFGGAEPPTTDGVWSWDADSLIVGTCADDLEIVPREHKGV